MATKKAKTPSLAANQDGDVPITFETLWEMTEHDVETVTKADQWTTFAIEVTGSHNVVAWICQPPEQVISLALDQTYGVYASLETEFADGTVLTSISRYPAELGTAYEWSGNGLVIDKDATCDRSSVKLTNNSNQAWTLGLTKYDPVSGKQQPICADVFLPGQPAEFTPVPVILAKVGWEDKVGAIVKDLGSGAWARLELTSLENTFHFDAHHTKWSV